MEKIIFRDEEHQKFYESKVEELNAEEYLIPLIYLAGLSNTTRKHWNEIYSEEEREINIEVMSAGWMTGMTKKILRLAFQLYTDRTITDTNYETGEGSIEECRRYSVSDIFCCEYAPYFVEALKIRYRIYFY